MHPLHPPPVSAPGALPTLKGAVLSLGSDDAFTDSLAQPVQKLWLIKVGRVKKVTRAELEG